MKLKKWHSPERDRAIAAQLRAYAKACRNWRTDEENKPNLEDLEDLARGLERQATRLEGKK